MPAFQKEDAGRRRHSAQLSGATCPPAAWDLVLKSQEGRGGCVAGVEWGTGGGVCSGCVPSQPGGGLCCKDTIGTSGARR